MNAVIIDPPPFLEEIRGNLHFCCARVNLRGDLVDCRRRLCSLDSTKEVENLELGVQGLGMKKYMGNIIFGSR